MLGGTQAHFTLSKKKTGDSQLVVVHALLHLAILNPEEDRLATKFEVIAAVPQVSVAIKVNYCNPLCMSR